MIALFALLLLAAPQWAKQADAADAAGHTFVCEGRGKSDEDALASAQAICNDKICKVCGIEVESITETKETLTGVDFQRKVVERCRRVRSGDTKLQYKSSDCEPSGCTAWIQIRYTKEDEQRECPRYARDDFADPAACEKDVDEFEHVPGRTAEAFRKRTSLLDAALGHCEKIDVRPTPAMLALDNKLHHGMDAFEWVPSGRDREGYGDDDRYVDRDRPIWGWYLPRPEPLRREISETRLLIDRIRLVRDYVANKALVMAVFDAAVSRAWDTPEGVERLRAALEKAPPGKQYGAAKVHFIALFDLARAKTDTSAVGALLRKLYPPESLEAGESWQLALYFKGDGRVTQEEWDYVFAAHRKHRCVECLRVMLEARDHQARDGGGEKVRLARFQQAWESIPKRGDPKRDFALFKSVIGYSRPELLLLVEDAVPLEARAFLDWDYFYEFISRFHKDDPEPARSAILARAAQALASGELDHSSCSSLADHLKRLQDAGGDPTPVHKRACECLSGPLKKEGEGYVNKSDLLDFAKQRELDCVSRVR
jgi:hypothetical protein